MIKRLSRILEPIDGKWNPRNRTAQTTGFVIFDEMRETLTPLERELFDMWWDDGHCRRYLSSEAEQELYKLLPNLHNACMAVTSYGL